MQQHRFRFSLLTGVFLTTCFTLLATAQAHLLVNNAMDVVVSRNRVQVDTRISLNQLWAVEPRHAEFDCHWNATPSPAVQTTQTRVDLQQNALSFLKQGIWHILTGYDHLLFVSGLVLATSSLWDLVKVVGAFTIAHSLTLMLCVLNIVNLSSRIVEPMISASIMAIAIQNIFWPRHSAGWWRIGIAFGFGLFHGLGFAGGLKDAMSELPSTAFWTALICFSVGVEIGHQLVVLPLYGSLRMNRHLRRNRVTLPLVPTTFRQWGSSAICVAGGYFLFQALHPTAH